MRCRRERKIEEIIEAENAGGGSLQLDVEKIMINGEDYDLKIINNPSLNNGVCHLNFVRKDAKGKDYVSYRILIGKNKINFIREGIKRDYTLYVKSSELGEDGLTWEYSPHANSEKDLKRLSVPFIDS